MTTAQSESLGDGSTSGYENFAQMSFTIEKATVTAKSRALKAEYTLELTQDLKATTVLMQNQNLQIFCQVRFLLKSTEKL